MAENKPELDNELDFDAVFAMLHRQARDKELEALANLTLLRTSYANNELSPEEREKQELDERLRRIISDLDRD